MIADNGVPWGVYGDFSVIHIFTTPNGRKIDPYTFDPLDCQFDELALKPKELTNNLRLALLINGVDFTGWPGGTVSIAHTENDLAMTGEAFARAINLLRQEEEI